MTTESSTEMTQFTPGGKQLDLGRSFADVWDDPQNEMVRIEEESAQTGDDNVISEEEKSAMARLHEPFTVVRVSEVISEQYGPRWKMLVLNAAGQERTLMMSQHPQRNGAVQAIDHEIERTGRAVPNVMLKFLFESKGNAFYVLRPWDGGGSTAPAY